MARDRDSFGLALSRLRADLRDGRFAPGAPLVTADLAATLRVSATPIREAVARLAGEGLLDDRRGRGVYAPHLASEEVEALYRLHEAYVLLAINARSKDYRPEADTSAAEVVEITPITLRARTERLWGDLMRRAEGQVIVRAHQRVVDQLAILRLAEAQVFVDLAGEMEALSLMMRDLQPSDWTVPIRTYHHRRRSHARALASIAFGSRQGPAI